MAHKGRAWKVWFRRDYSLNTRTELGYAESYHAGINGVFFNPFGQEVPLGGRATNTEKGAGDNRTWKLGPIAAFGLNWGVLFTVDNDPVDGFTDLEITVLTAELGPMLIVLYKNPEKQFFYGSWTNFQAPTIEFKRSIIGYSGSTADMFAWTWFDGP